MYAVASKLYYESVTMVFIRYILNLYIDISFSIKFISVNFRLGYSIINMYLIFPPTLFTILKEVAATTLTSKDGRH